MPILAQIVCLLIWTTSTEIHAEVSTEITSSGLNTVVTSPTQGGTIYGITQGTPVGNNVFHSFGKFSVGPLDTAQFQTTNLTPNSSISNVLARVTGGNPSHLFGTIDSASYYPNASLFFLNPAGIVFGPNAILDVGGSVSFTTAGYLRLADGSFFNSTPNAAADALLSATPVETFGFLNSNAGSIAVQGARLSVSTGSRLVLVGGDVTIQAWRSEDGATQTAKLFAPNGHIHLGNARSPGEFTSPDLQSSPNRDGKVFHTHGMVLLSPNSWIDNSHSDTGIVSIHSGAFSLDVTNSLLSTESTTTARPPTNSIALAGGSRILGTTTSGADGTAIQVVTGSLEMRNGSQIVVSNEGSQLVEGGANIFATDAITISGYNETFTSGIWSDIGIIPSGIFTGTLSGGSNGTLSITTPKLTIENSGEIATFSAGIGSGQTISIDVKKLDIRTGGRIATANGWNYLSREFGDGPGHTGPIVIRGANSISVSGVGNFENKSSIQTASHGSNGGGSASIHIASPSATVNIENGGQIQTLPGQGTEPTGNISLLVRNLNVTNGSIRTSGGAGRSGSISVLASDSISLQGDALGQPSFSLINENIEGSGGTGVIALETKTLILADQAGIQSYTFSAPETSTTPKLDIRATESITSKDRSNISVVTVLSPVGNVKIVSPTISLSRLATINTVGQNTGNSGAVTINTDNLSLEQGGKINSSVLSGSSGQGGPITIRGLNGTTAAQSIKISGPGSGLFSETKGPGSGGQITTHSNEFRLTDHATISSKTSGTGDAGNILIKANDVSVTGGATITAASTGTGNAGTVTIQGLHSPANSFLLDGAGSSVLTSTTKTGAGGAILIEAKDVLLRNGGTVSAKTTGTTTSATGGTITIQGDRVRIENGALVTSSSSGAARGGSIAVTATESVSVTDGAAISASSTGSGDAGSIAINAGRRFDMQNGSVTTSASHATGGNIEVNATDLVRVINGQISTSVLGGTGNGGNISIDPNTVILQNTQIVAKAVSGAGGNISITTPLFLADQSSLVDASSQFGLNGTVTIQSPTSNLSGTIGQLSSKPAPIHLLAQNRCAALADGQQSTFILSGRQTFPTIPGGWTPSPFTPLTMDTLEPNEARVPPVNFGNTGLLTLRSLTSPGFFVRSFPTNEQAGCRL